MSSAPAINLERYKLLIEQSACATEENKTASFIRLFTYLDSVDLLAAPDIALEVRRQCFGVRSMGQELTILDRSTQEIGRQLIQLSQSILKKTESLVDLEDETKARSLEVAFKEVTAILGIINSGAPYNPDVIIHRCDVVLATFTKVRSMCSNMLRTSTDVIEQEQLETICGIITNHYNSITKVRDTLIMAQNQSPNINKVSQHAA